MSPISKTIVTLFSAFILVAGCAPMRPYSPPATVPHRTPPPPVATRPKPSAPAPSVQRPRPTPPRPLPSPQPPAQAPPPAPATPRALAALNLVDQGKALIDQNRPDDAIRVLERAVQVHSREGKGYYYLAEAWLMKGNRRQAAQFNRLAGIYLRNDSKWSNYVERQRQRIGIP